MNILRQLESCSERERSSRIGQLGVKQAILELPPEDAIAWLDRWLPSSIGSTWGFYLARCHPAVPELVGWIDRGGAHRIAALDAFQYLSTDPEYGIKPDEKTLVANELDQIASNSPSPRIEDLLARIRHNWKLTEPREPVAIPKTILLIAECLLRFQPDLVGTWSEALQQEYRRPETAWGFWTSLGYFAGENGAMAICDHREEIESVVAKLSSIRSSDDIQRILRHHAADYDSIDSFCRNAARSLASANLSLASIDSGSDMYWLTINYRDSLLELENLLAAALPDSPLVNIY